MDMSPPTVEWLEQLHYLRNLWRIVLIRAFQERQGFGRLHPLYLKLWRENHRSAPKTLLEISEGTVRKRIFLTN